MQNGKITLINTYIFAKTFDEVCLILVLLAICLIIDTNYRCVYLVMEFCWKFYNKMRFEVVSFGVLWLFCMLNDVKSNSCNYFQDLELGVIYYAYYPNNLYNSTGKNRCIWKTNSDYITKLNCSIQIPKSIDCDRESISIQSGDVTPRKYCGSGTLTFEGKNLTIIYDSKDSQGRFLCEIEAKDYGRTNCACGWQNPTRIVGGTETGVNEYPMMAGIVDSNIREIYCGATIISEKYVITAAHCLINRDFSVLGIVVGEHDVTTGSETDVTKLYLMSEYKIHPGYEYDKIHNDIALCKIRDTIKFSSKVGPVCLPFQHKWDSFDGDNATVLGWGLTEFGGQKSDTLQEVNLYVISNRDCEIDVNDINENNICTYAPNKDACQMDSGGPVLWKYYQRDRLVLIGIVSSGEGCAFDKPGINTRVGPFINWILAETGEQYCMVA